MAEFNFQQWAADQRAANNNYVSGLDSLRQALPGYSNDFYNYYQRVAEANGRVPYYSDEFTSRAFENEDNDNHNKNVKYRKMTDLERFSAGARQASDFINNAVGNFLFGTPDNPVTGEIGQQGVFGKPSINDDLSAIKLENAPRMIANIPGMFIGSVPDIAAYGSELIAGTPAQEGNLETDMIADRSLTAEERGADLLYGGLSALSFIPGFSVESKLAGAGMKAAGKASGKRLIEEAGNIGLKGELGGMGMVEKSAFNAGKRGAELNSARWKDAAAGAMASSAFEAFQEGAQTSAEDIRYHRFDLDDPNETKKRVAEGAFWGGLAGGIVGGAPGAIRAGVKNSQANRGIGSDPQTDSEAGNGEMFKRTSQSDWEQLQRPGDPSRLAPGMYEYYDNLVKADNRLKSAGSVNLIFKTSDSSRELNSWGVGALDFADAWNQGDKAKEGMARQMSRGSVPIKDAIKIIDNAVNNNIVDGVKHNSLKDALNAVNKKWNGKRGFEAAIEKRPGAKYTGGYGYVTEFIDGRGFVCHPALVKQINADFDSDMGVLHFVTRDANNRPLLSLDGYFGEKVLSPEGSSLVDFYYTDFVKGRFDPATFKGKLFEIFDPYVNKKKIVNDFVDRMVKVINDPNHTDHDIGRILEDIRNTVITLRRAALAEQEADFDKSGKESVLSKEYLEKHPDFNVKQLRRPESAISLLFRSDNGEKIALETLRENGKTIRTETLRKALFGAIKEDDTVPSNVKEYLANFDMSSTPTRHGKISGSGHSIDVYEKIGLALWTLETAANQPFRQHGQMGYNNAKMQGAYHSAWEMLSKAGLSSDVIDSIIRCSFKISRMGTTPLDAIEGLIDSRIVDTTERKFGLANRKIASEDDFDAFEDFFVEAWDQGAKDYESVRMLPTMDGDIIDPSAPKRSEIKGATREQKDMKLFNLFNDHTIDSMFDDVPSDLKGITFGEIIEDIVRNTGKFPRIFVNSANPSMNNIIDRAVSARISEVRGTRKGVETQLRNVKLDGVLNRKVKNGGKIHPSDWGAVRWYVQMLVDYITPEGFHYLGVTDIVDFLENTKIGERLIDPNPDVRLNVIYALMAKAKFGIYQDAIKGRIPGLTEEEQKTARENAIFNLAMNYNGRGGVAEVIAYEMAANDGDSVTFDMVTSLDGYFDDKERMYKSRFGEDPGTDFLVDMLVDSKDDFSISTVAKKKNTADISYSMYQRNLFAESRASIASIKSDIERGVISGNMFAAAMNCAALKGRVDFNDDSVALSIWNSLATAHTKQEKGIETSSASSIYDGGVLSAIGQPVSYVESITSYESGAVSVDNFANNPKLIMLLLSGQDLTPILGENNIRVFSGSKTRELSRDWVFEQVSPTYNPEIGPVQEDWLCFFDRFPQYEAYFAGLVTQPVMTGGQGSAVISKTGSLYDVVKKYNGDVTNPDEGGPDPIVDAEIEHMRAIAKNEALQHTGFGWMSIYHLPSLSDPNNATKSAINSGYKEASKRLLDCMLYDALTEQGSKVDKAEADRIVQMRASGLRSNFETIRDSIDQAKMDMDMYAEDLFSMNNQIDTIVESANKSAFERDAAQLVVDQYCQTNHIDTKDSNAFDVDIVSRTDGALSDGQLEIIELQLLAEHTIDEIQRIIEETEYIDEDSGITGQPNTMKGLGFDEDNISVSIDSIRNSVENTLRKNGIDPTVVAISDEDLIDAQKATYRQRFYSSHATSRLSNTLRKAGRDPEKMLRNIPNLRVDMMPRVRSGKMSDFYTTMDDIIDYLKNRNAFRDYEKDPVSFVNQFYKENEKGELVLNERDWRDFVRIVNNRVIETTLNETNSVLNIDINSNAYMAAYEYYATYDQIVDKIRDALRKSPNPYSGEKGNMYLRSLANEFETPIRPVPDFTDKINQGAASEYTLSMNGAPIPSGISSSGGYLKQANLMSWLPATRAGDIKPTLMTVDQIKDLRIKHDDIDQWICVKDGTWAPGQSAYDGKQYTITTVGARLKSGEDLSQGIEVFHPEDNPHGMWVTNTPASLTTTRRPALRLSSINGGIIDASQEPLFLKLKKRFERRLSLIRDRDKFGSRSAGIYSKNTDVITDVNSDASLNEIETMRSGLVDTLKAYRREFADEINGLFEDELKDTGYGKTQALIYAQGLTPGMICKINGKDVCISADALFNQVKFQKIVSDIVKSDKEFFFETGHAFIVDPSEIHYRIRDAVEQGQRVADSTGSKLNRSQIANDAYERCTSGWNTWLDEDNQLSIDEIFSRGSAIGWHHRSRLVPEDAPTPYSKLLDIMYEGKSGAVAKSTLPNWYNINPKTNKEWTSAINSVTRYLNITGEIPKVKVLKVLVDKESKNVYTATGSHQDYWTALNGIPENAHWASPGEVGVVFTDDINMLEDALKWADRTGNSVVMPEEFVDFLRKNRDVSSSIRYGVSVRDYSSSFVLYDTRAAKARSLAQKVDNVSSVTPFDRESIYGTCLDESHLFLAGDATLQVVGDFSQNLYESNVSKQSVRGLTNGIMGKVNIINNKESADKLLAELFNEDGTVKSNEDWRNACMELTAKRIKDIPLSTLQLDIRDFLQSISSESKTVDEDGFNRRNAGRNKILGIMNVEAANGDRAVVPIIAPNNSPKKYDSCRIAIGSDGNIYIVYSANLNTFGRSPEEQYFKASLPDMSFKGVVALRPESTPAPTYIVPNSTSGRGSKNNQGKIALITSWDTVKSRRPGREMECQISDMWYFAKAHGMSALVDRNGNIKQHIIDQYKDKATGEIDWAGINNLFAGMRTEWAKFARGEKTLIPDTEENRKTINLHKEIIRNYIDSVDMVQLFSPGWERAGELSWHNIRFYMALKPSLYNQDLILRFFNSIDNDLCPNGLNEQRDINSFMFDYDGRFHMNYKGEAYWEYVSWNAPDGIGAFSELAGSSQQAGESHQAFTRLAMDKGFNPRDLQMAIDYTTLQAGDPKLYREKMLKDFATRKADDITSPRKNRYASENRSLFYASRKEREQQQNVRNCGKTFLPENRRKVYYNGHEIENPYSSRIDGIEGNPVSDAVGNLQSKFNIPLSTEVLSNLSYAITGHTYNDGKGANKISLNGLADTYHEMTRNIEEHGLVVVSRNVWANNRIPQPLLNQRLARLVWDSCEEIQQHEDNMIDGKPNFDKFVSRMMEQQEATDTELNKMMGGKYQAKALECLTMSEYNWQQWDKPGKSGIIYEVWTPAQVIKATNWLIEPEIQELEADGYNIAHLRELSENSAKIMADTRAMVDGRKFTRESPSPNARNGVIGKLPNDYSRSYHKVFRYATDTSALMGVMDPFMMPSNVAYRGIHQSIMSRVMSVGRKLIVGDDYSPNQNILRAAARNDFDTKALWGVMREAAFHGDQDEFFAYIQQGNTVSEYLDMKASEPGSLQKKYQKAKNLIFKMASGGNIGITRQIENFFNRIVFFFNEDPELQAYWLKKDENGFNNMDKVLSKPGGGAEFIRMVFADSDENISYLAALNALEDCRSADVAQSHIAIEMFKNATNRNPIPEFLARTTIARYPGYAMNFFEECVNLVFPMHTLKYAWTEFIAEVGHEKAAKSAQEGGNYVDPHYEKYQRNANLREAMLVDMLHFGAFGMLCILAGLPGAIEPPEDKNKWGNYKEWLILQHRVGEAWWVEDILGIVAPAACFWKSVQLGKPRFDLIFNGVQDVCYNNPMVKMSDAVSFILDPMGEINTDYEAMMEKYGNSPEGGPGFMDYIQANGTSFGLSYLSQFFTPTFIKSMTNWATPYELDYKNVYTENVRGTLTDEGQAGEDLTKVSYEEAMIRRLTRKNPVLALVMDLTHPGTTSYSGIAAIANLSGKKPMPYTRYLDQYQYNAMKQWSISGLSDEDAQAKTLQIISLLMEYQDDLGSLAATGFYLDSPTKKAVSSMIWDTCYQLDLEWNEFCKSDQSDFTILGSGDWTAGKQKYYELYGLYKNNRRELENFYYKTMKSKELTSPIVEYRRYNTTYAQDDNGEWYATGYHPQGLLPFISAPGTLTDPEGTAGYENDFVTVSAATGMPLYGMRALVPYNDGEYVEWPNLEDWSDDGNGSGYSKQYQDWYGTDGSGTSTKSSKSSASSGSGSPSGSGGSRGGGGSGGGGGRSYVPNTSAPSVSLPKANPSRIMNTDRAVKPSYEYLRPDFETKGSREAYRRSDI